jgi:hypothetical protein
LDPPILQGLAYGFFSGVCGSFTYSATKIGFLLWGDPHSWSNWVFYMFWLGACVAELGNIVSTNIGMYYQEAMVVVPAYYVSMSVFTTLQTLALFSLYEVS